METKPEQRQTSLFDRAPTSSSPRSNGRLGCHATAIAIAPQRIDAVPRVATAEPTLRIADVFAGIGGFHLGFRQIGARCVFASENDRAARRTYEMNFGASEPALFESGNFVGDIAGVRSSTIPDHDILTAGFPCQPFSSAGNRQGFSDERGVMFYHLARILGDKRPAAFMFENVAGLRLHNQGATFAAIRQTLTTQLGYSLHTAVLRACDYGLPQLRPRLFMVGFRDPSTPFEFPEPIPLRSSISDVFGAHCDREIGRTVLASGFGKRVGQSFNWDAYLVDGVERRLSPRQAAALQGFPDDFVLPTSTAQAFKQVGNAVAVPVVAAIAKSIQTSLNSVICTATHDSEAQS